MLVHSYWKPQQIFLSAVEVHYVYTQYTLYILYIYKDFETTGVKKCGQNS